MRFLPALFLAAIIASPASFAADEKPKALLFDVTKVPQGRQKNCYAFFEELFGEHVAKEGQVSRFPEVAGYYEWRDYRVQKKKEIGYISYIRVRAHGKGMVRMGRLIDENVLKTLDDTAERLNTIEFVLYLPADARVQDIVDLLVECLGADKYTSRDRDFFGDESAADFLTSHDYGLLEIKDGAVVNFARPHRGLKTDPDQPGIPVEVQVIVSPRG